jgi:hypothetical protein
MKEKIIIVIIVMVIALLAVVGCATTPKRQVGSEAVVEKSATKIPEWVFKVPEDTEEYMYFRGIRTNATSLEAANDDARRNALTQVLEMINTKGMVDYTSVRMEKGPQEAPIVERIVQDGLKILSENVTKGVREKEVYWEKVERLTETGVLYFYNAYVLITLPKEEYKKALKDTVKEQKEKAQREADREALEFLKKLEEEFEGY